MHDSHAARHCHLCRAAFIQVAKGEYNTMYINGRRVIYVALKLDTISKSQLSEMAHLDMVYCDHVTLAFGKDVTMSHIACLGRTAQVETGELWSDGTATALTVAWPSNMCPCCTAQAHVTIATKAGVKPVHSNDLFRDTKNRGRKVDMLVKGVIEAFLDNGTWTLYGVPA